MKLICIRHYYGCSITIQRVYDFSIKFDGLEQWNNTNRKCVYVIDDDGKNAEYPKTCFMPLDEYRNSKIEEILI